MPPSALREALAQLDRHALLLATDPKLPSVTTLVAGEPVRGSWWSHPRAHAIFAVMEGLVGHGDVAVAKLVSGKVTYVHRALWPALVGAGQGAEAWQTASLSPAARRLWSLLLDAPVLRTDEVASPRLRGRPLGDAVRELERALLVHSEEVHTAGGAHAKRLQTWERWGRHQDVAPLPAGEARGRLEAVLASINARFGGRGRLPWQGGPSAPPTC